MRGILWLASYPKSGNTWFRVFLTNLRQDTQGPTSINALDPIRFAGERAMFEEATGVESSDLTKQEIERLRPMVYEYIAKENENTLFVKVHDAYTYTAGGQPLFPAKATVGAIYIIRNPLDVAASYTHSSSLDLDTVISHMINPDFTLSAEPLRLHEQLPQRLLTWSGHVLSWADAPGIRVHIVRYEDMKLRPLETFTEAVHFLRFQYDRQNIQTAIELSSFDELKRQEQAHGFREKYLGDRPFFHKGKIGSWRQVLTADQAKRIVCDHRDVMGRFGYLDKEDQVVF